MGMNINRSYRGSSAAQGTVPLALTALPAHRYEDYRKVDNVLTEDTRFKTLSVQIGDTATVEFQGTAGDPAVEDEWFTLGTASSTGVISSEIPTRFVRANVTSHTSGDVDVQITVTE